MEVISEEKQEDLEDAQDQDDTTVPKVISGAQVEVVVPQNKGEIKTKIFQLIESGESIEHLQLQ